PFACPDPLHPSLPLRSSHSHRLPRHLHSFPTRRSSDLPRGRVLDTDVGRQVQLDALFLDVSAFAAPDVADALDVDEESVELNLPDRKSTRLNSSHVEISYAVFCLKKKKLETQQ